MTRSGSRARVAVVCGATRGAGRGAARALGEAGYLVVCTGRSTAHEPSPYAMPETLEETVALVDAATRRAHGAREDLPRAVALRVDHASHAEVAALFERVAAEHGPIEVVVDGVAGDDPAFGMSAGMIDGDPAQIEVALRSALVTRMVTAQLAARALRDAARGRTSEAAAQSGAARVPLLVEISEYDLVLGVSGNLLSTVVRSTLKILAATLAEELRADGVAAVSITPGFLRSEAVLRYFKVTAERWRDAGAEDPHFLHSESPLFVGRAIAALAADPRALDRTALVWSSWELASAYGVVDEDGTRPDWGAHWRDVVVPTMPVLRASIEHQVAWLEALAARGREQLAGPR